MYPGIYIIKNLTFVVLLPIPILWVFCVYNFFMTAYSDPGIIPRGSLSREEFKENDEIKDLYGNNKNMNIQKESLVPGFGDPDGLDEKGKKDLEIQNDRIQKYVYLGIYTYRYCETCKIARPPLASHCNECGNCVRGFDQ